MHYFLSLPFFVLAGFPEGKDGFNIKKIKESYRLPFDTANRLRNGNLWIEDIDVLDKHGWTAKASELKAQVAEAEKQILEKKIAEAKARNDERDRKLAEYQKLDPMQKLAMNPPSEAAIQQARREWNITGEPTF